MTYLFAIGRFLKRVPWQLYAAIAAALLVWAAVEYHQAAAKAAHDEAYAAGVLDTTKTFEAAQSEADRLARAAVAAKVTQQAAISKESSHAFAQDNADIRARSDALRLRHEAAARDRASGGVDLSAASLASSGPGAPAACDGLPWSTAHALMTQAALDLAQLNRVLDFEAAQDALALQEAALAHTEAH